MNKLITYAYLKQETDISDNVDDTKLENPIKRAQERLRALIGPSFYNEIISQVITTPKTLSVDNQAFFDPYVKEYLAWQAYEIYFSKANTYETRTGIRVFKEENSDAASDKAIGEQLSLARQDVKYKKEAMLGFLRTAQRVTSTKYPLYTNKNNYSTGGGFGISAVSKIDTVNFSIENSVVNQEPSGGDNFSPPAPTNLPYPQP